MSTKIENTEQILVDKVIYDQLTDIYYQSMDSTSTQIVATKVEIVAFIGPMFGGKSSEGFAHLSVRKCLGDCTMYATYLKDTRFEDEHIETHRGIYISDHIDIVFKSMKLMEIIDNHSIDRFDAICIDEAQFYPDLPEFIDYMRENWHGIIYVCGLVGSYKMEKFGQISEILHLCSDVIFKHSYCIKCHEEGVTKHASFTARKEGISGGLIVIGGEDEYYPVCAKHHCVN